MNVLITLHPGYGLGDSVQMSAVLRHVAKYRPEWRVDYGAEDGRHEVGRGLVANTFALGQPYPSTHYDAEVQIVLYDNFPNWSDRPNTRVATCLNERFGLPWDPECGRYQVNVSTEVTEEVQHRLTSMVPHQFARSKRVVAIHYQGDSAPDKKDLAHAQADVICDAVLALDCVPLLLDWRNISPIANRRDVGTTGRAYFSRAWGRSAEYNCAVIARCAAFVGIDSGPGKCASATDTPSLIVWTGHHLCAFHDPAPNTTHLSPEGYHHTLFPGNFDPEIIEWIEKNYQTRTYENDPVKQVKAWLQEVLK